MFYFVPLLICTFVLFCFNKYQRRGMQFVFKNVNSLINTFNQSWRKFAWYWVSAVHADILAIFLKNEYFCTKFKFSKEKIQKYQKNFLKTFLSESFDSPGREKTWFINLECYSYVKQTLQLLKMVEDSLLYGIWIIPHCNDNFKILRHFLGIFRIFFKVEALKLLHSIEIYLLL